MKRIVIVASLVGLCLIGAIIYFVTRPKIGDEISTSPALKALISDEVKRRYRRNVADVKTFHCGEMVSFAVKLQGIGGNFNGNVQELFNDYSGFGFQKKSGDWSALVRSWKLDNDVCKDATDFLQSLREQ